MTHFILHGSSEGCLKLDRRDKSKPNSGMLEKEEGRLSFLYLALPSDWLKEHFWARECFWDKCRLCPMIWDTHFLGAKGC